MVSLMETKWRRFNGNKERVKTESRKENGQVVEVSGKKEEKWMTADSKGDIERSDRVQNGKEQDWEKRE